MTGAGIGTELTLARLEDGTVRGPMVPRCTVNRIEAEVRHHVPDEEWKALRLKLIRLHVGDELVIEDPRRAGAAWSARRTR